MVIVCDYNPIVWLERVRHEDGKFDTRLLYALKFHLQNQPIKKNDFMLVNHI